MKRYWIFVFVNTFSFKMIQMQGRPLDVWHKKHVRSALTCISKSSTPSSLSVTKQSAFSFVRVKWQWSSMARAKWNALLWKKERKVSPLHERKEEVPSGISEANCSHKARAKWVLPHGIGKTKCYNLAQAMQVPRVYIVFIKDLGC